MIHAMKYLYNIGYYTQYDDYDYDNIIIAIKYMMVILWTIRNCEDQICQIKCTRYRQWLSYHVFPSILYQMWWYWSLFFVWVITYASYIHFKLYIKSIVDNLFNNCHLVEKEFDENNEYDYYDYDSLTYPEYAQNVLRMIIMIINTSSFSTFTC